LSRRLKLSSEYYRLHLWLPLHLSHCSPPVTDGDLKAHIKGSTHYGRCAGSGESTFGKSSVPKVLSSPPPLPPLTLLRLENRFGDPNETPGHTSRPMTSSLSLSQSHGSSRAQTSSSTRGSLRPKSPQPALHLKVFSMDKFEESLAAIKVNKITYLLPSPLSNLFHSLVNRGPTTDSNRFLFSSPISSL
jgi:hypothetical protein